jgi:hypothetical protein
VGTAGGTDRETGGGVAGELLGAAGLVAAGLVVAAACVGVVEEVAPDGALDPHPATAASAAAASAATAAARGVLFMIVSVPRWPAAA